MNDVEQRIREGLGSEVDRFRHRDRASLGPPSLSPRIRRRVRRRQIGTMVLSLALAAGLAVGGIQAVDAFRSGHAVTPADTFSPPTGTQPAPRGWPTVIFGAGKPFVRYEPGQRAYIAGSKQVVAYGTASYRSFPDVPWTIAAYEVERGLYPDDTIIYRDEVWCDFRLGDTYHPDPNAGACGGRVSHSDHPNVPNWMALQTSFNGNLPFDAYVGVLAPRVTRVEVIPDGARPFEARTLPAPRAFDRSYFVFFAPHHTSGEVLAYDPEGNLLQRTTFCQPSVQLPKSVKGFLSGGGTSFGGGGSSTGTAASSTAVAGGTTTTAGSTTTTTTGSGSIATGTSDTVTVDFCG